jgi:hypothetical protein
VTGCPRQGGTRRDGLSHVGPVTLGDLSGTEVAIPRDMNTMDPECPHCGERDWVEEHDSHGTSLRCAECDYLADDEGPDTLESVGMSQDDFLR